MSGKALGTRRAGLGWAGAGRTLDQFLASFVDVLCRFRRHCASAHAALDPEMVQSAKRHRVKVEKSVE
jgi:hypothetical protein